MDHINILRLTVWGLNQIANFCRQHFTINFLEQKLLKFVQSLTEACFNGQWQVSISPDNGLVLKRQQAIFLIMFDNVADDRIGANICLINVWLTGHSELPTALKSDIRYNKHLRAKWNLSCQRSSFKNMCKVAIEQCYVIRLVKMMYLFFRVCCCAQITTDNIHSCLTRFIGTKIHAQHVV